jgi:glycosyltransferase 2 family protein
LMLNFLGAQPDWAQTIIILSAGRLAFLLGVPGGIGTLEGSLVIAAQMAGLSAAIGLAAGLVIHLRDIGIGLIGLWIAGWSSRSSVHTG